MMMESGTPDRWIYKRNRTIQTARSDAVRVSEAGIPYLAPIQVLLFKAKYCRKKTKKISIFLCPNCLRKRGSN